MTKHILFKDGKLASRYDSGIHGDNIPAEAIEVSDELFFQTINETDGVWSLVDGVIVKLPFPAPDPAVVKASQWEAIKAQREKVKAGGVKVGTKWFHSDIESRVQHLGLKDKARDLLAAGGTMTDRLQVGGVDIQWKTMNGTLIYITAQIAFDIVAAVGVLDALAHQNAEVHKVKMETSAEPTAYDFNGGWPAVYVG
jgi:hypothetical protein